MELNREEIIKALECCIKAETWGDCADSGCPACQKQGCYFYLRTAEDNENTIYIEIFKDVLALIKELTKENERLKERVSNQREELHKCNNTIRNITQSRNTWKKQAEKVGKQLYETLNDKKQVKADTVRKMQEKIMSYDGGGQ
jgi:hypothetical protein